MGRQKTNARVIAQREREREILELRRAGASYQEISDTLGVAKSSAHKAVTRCIEEITRDPAASVAKLELARLDALQAELWAMARKGGAQALPVIDRILKIMERRARLLGLDAPTKQELTGKDGVPLQGEPTAALAAALIRQAFGEHAVSNGTGDSGDSGPQGDGALPPAPSGT